MDADGSNLTRLTNNSALGFNSYPSWSPDGGKIVFCNITGDIYSKFKISMDVMDSDGSNLFSVTNSAAFFDCSPAWSPDSAKMAFTSDRDGNVEIYVIGADGANETRLTDNPADDVNPQWSPDGSKIVFSSGSGACETDFKETPADPSDGPPRNTCEGKTTEERFRHMVFVDEIYVIDADGSNLTRLTRNTSDVDDRLPAWSPDGSKIAFLSDRDENVYQIYTMDADGFNQTRLTNKPRGILCFEWSPDGTKIAFGSEEGTHMMDADGSGGTRLNTLNTCISDLAWSPAGENIVKIMFSESGEIYAMDPDGFNYFKLTNSPGSKDQRPAWSPGVVPPFQSQPSYTQTPVYTLSAATSTPAPTPTSLPFPSPTPTLTPTYASGPINFYGEGNHTSPVFTLDPGIAIFSMTHDGESNFAVWFSDNNGLRLQRLARVIGHFDGTRGIHISTAEGYTFEVLADGAWIVSIQQ